MTATAGSRPFAVASGRATAVWFLGQPLEIKVTGEQTGGAYAVTEADAVPGFGPSAHIHHREDEAVYVLDGELLFNIDGEQLHAPTGSFVHIPKGLIHAWKSVATIPTKMLTIYTPAGFERIFEALGEPIIDRAAWPSTRLDPETLRERGTVYGLEIPERA
jgi:quercetin dioxygenase-like cupin family protein